MASLETPPQAPKGQYRNYADVPWFRRSETNTAFLLIHLLTCGCLPLLLLTCIILLTGDVYYNQTLAGGNLKTWSFANKVVAAVLLVFNVVILVFIFAAPFLAAVAETPN